MKALYSFYFVLLYTFVSAELKLCHNGNPGQLNGRLTLGWGTPFPEAGKIRPGRYEA
jgi:hypothetical protein